MGDATAIVKETNVALKAALKECAALRGKNAFLDLALDAGRLFLPEETKLIGYPKQEKAFLIFLKTVEPHLPKTPGAGTRSVGQVMLRSEADATWVVHFHYGPQPHIDVQKLSWVPVAFGRVGPLRARTSPPKAKSDSGELESRVRAAPKSAPKQARFVDPTGHFVVARVAANRLVVVRGDAGSGGKKATRIFAHKWQAEAAFEKLAVALRQKNYRRARGM